MKFAFIIICLFLIKTNCENNITTILDLMKNFSKHDTVGEFIIDKENLNTVLSTGTIDNIGKAKIRFIPFRDKSMMFHMILSNNAFKDKFSSLTLSMNYKEVSTSIDKQNEEITFKVSNFTNKALYKDFRFFFIVDANKVGIESLEVKYNTSNYTIEVALHMKDKYIDSLISMKGVLSKKRTSNINYAIFSVLLISISLAHLISNTYIIYENYKKQIDIKHISFLFIHLDIVWNSMQCIILANISSQIEFECESFCFVAFIYFFIFAFCQTYLIFLLRRGKEFTCMEMIKTLVFECLIIITTYLFTSYFKYFYWLIYIVYPFTFIPQIYHIAVNKIKKSTVPFIIYQSFFFNKVFFCTACSFNGDFFFNFRKNIINGLFGLLFHLIQLLVLYCMNNYGYDFCLPLNKRNTIYKYMIRFEDIINSNGSLSYFLKEKCPICLNELMKIEDITVNESHRKIEMKETKDDDIKVNVSSDEITSINSNQCVIDVKGSRCNCHRWYWRANKKKSIAITPCKHLFHPWCIEEWWRVKKECPFCRSPLPNIDI